MRLFHPPLPAQDSPSIDTSLLLQTLQVTAPRQARSQAQPYLTETLSKERLREVQPLNTAAALEAIPGVYVQRSQLGGGSPVIRGFEANRILLTVDGVRMNNAIYRGGHLQNAITVDAEALGEARVVFGPGALRYGSDAIGGVVDLRTERLDFDSLVGWGGRAGLRFSTAALATVVSAGLDYGSEGFAAKTRVSVANYNDLRAGGWRSPPHAGWRRRYVVWGADGRDSLVFNDDPNVQIGTAYRQVNALQKFGWRLSAGRTLVANLQFSTTGNVPRYDALNETRGGFPRWARWDYGPQTRLLAALTYTNANPRRLSDVFELQASRQFVEEDRLRRRFRDPLTERSRVDVHVRQLRADAHKALGQATTLRYGADLRYETVDATSNLSPRYPSGGNALLAGGAYTGVSHALPRYWSGSVGLRYGAQRLRSVFEDDPLIDWPEPYLDGVTNTTDALTAAASLQYLRQRYRLRLLAGQAFRAPNLDDFTKFREQNGRVQIPNLDLRPERSNTLELNGDWRPADWFYVSAAVHHTWLTHAIVRRDGRLPDGSRSFVSRGDTLDVQANANAESARVLGFDLKLELRPVEYWVLTSDFHFLRGRRSQGFATPSGPPEVLTTPQDHIPPPFGQTALALDRGRLRATFLLRYHLAKPTDEYAVNARRPDGTFDRIGTPDNLELTPNRAGTPAWWTANIYLTLTPKHPPLTLRFKIENLFDRHYRPFASGVSAAGVDVGIGATLHF